jgi:hypothetical protein
VRLQERSLFFRLTAQNKHNACQSRSCRLANCSALIFLLSTGLIVIALPKKWAVIEKS